MYREAFKLFDKDNKGQVIQDEAPSIMRYLGVYPTEKDIVKEVRLTPAHKNFHEYQRPHVTSFYLLPQPCVIVAAAINNARQPLSLSNSLSFLAITLDHPCHDGGGYANQDGAVRQVRG